MSKDPAFLFYPNDWLGGTMGMDFGMKGAYIDLLIFQFNNSHFTELQAKHMLSTSFASVWEVLSTKFKTEGENREFFYNERLRDEITKRKLFAESRRINALHPKKPRKKTKAYAKHMGNENKDINIDINKKKNNSNFVLPSWIPEETWKAYLAIRLKKKAAKTDYALSLIIKELQNIEDQYGHNPVMVLNKSIKSGWIDVYPLKENDATGGKNPW